MKMPKVSKEKNLHLRNVINIKNLKCLAYVASRPRVGVAVRWRESAEPYVAWKERTVENGQAWRGDARGWPRVSGGGGGGSRSGGSGSGGGTKRWRFSLSSPGTARRGFK